MALIQLTPGMTEQEERTTQNTNNLYLDVVKLPKASVNPAALSPGQKVMTTDTGEVGIKSAGGDIIWYAHATDLSAHTARTDNPHGVTASQTGALSKCKVVQLNHSTTAPYTNETQSITLGFRPKLVKIRAVANVTSNPYYDSDGASDGSTQSAIYKYGNTTDAPNATTSKIVYIHVGNAYNIAGITFTDTGFTLTWSSSGALPVFDIKMLITAIG